MASDLFRAMETTAKVAQKLKRDSFYKRGHIPKSFPELPETNTGKSTMENTPNDIYIAPAGCRTRCEYDIIVRREVVITHIFIHSPDARP